MRQNVEPYSLETPLCKGIVPFCNIFEDEDRCLEGKDLNQKQSQRKKTEKKSNTAPKGVETWSNKLEQQSKVKPNLGTLEKPGRRSSRKTRELESLQNIIDGRQATILGFTPRKLL